jgi:hypothetical protein
MNTATPNVFEHLIMYVEMVLVVNGLALPEQEIPKLVFDILTSQRGKAIHTLRKNNRNSKLTFRQLADLVDFIRLNADVVRNW